MERTQERSIGKEYKRQLCEKIISDSSSLTIVQLLELLLSYTVSSDEYLQKSRDVYDELVDKEAILSPEALFLLLGKENEETMTFFKALSGISKKGFETECCVDFADYHAVGEFFSKSIGGDIVESLCIVFLREDNSLLKIENKSYGVIDKVFADIKLLVSEALTLGAQKVIVAHNHPSGSLLYSNNDFEFTVNLEAEMKLIGVDLLEHYVVTSDGYSGILKRHFR